MTLFKLTVLSLLVVSGGFANAENAKTLPDFKLFKSKTTATKTVEETAIDYSKYVGDGIETEPQNFERQTRGFQAHKAEQSVPDAKPTHNNDEAGISPVQPRMKHVAAVPLEVMITKGSVRDDLSVKANSSQTESLQADTETQLLDIESSEPATESTEVELIVPKRCGDSEFSFKLEKGLLLDNVERLLKDFVGDHQLIYKVGRHEVFAEGCVQGQSFRHLLQKIIGTYSSPESIFALQFDFNVFAIFYSSDEEMARYLKRAR